jgi:hypothetical protein
VLDNKQRSRGFAIAESHDELSRVITGDTTIACRELMRSRRRFDGSVDYSHPHEFQNTVESN